MSAKKTRGSFYISKRFDVMLSTVIVADDFDKAVVAAKAMAFSDFLKTGDCTTETLENLPGLTVSEQP
jgi:hypothetical protein